MSLLFNNCDVHDMAENFENKNEEIYELTNFLNNNIDDDLSVEIEFAPINEITHFNIKKYKEGKYINLSDNYDIIFNSKETKSALKKIGWNKKDLKNFKKENEES